MVKAVAVTPSTSSHKRVREFVEADTVNPPDGKRNIIVWIVVFR